MGRPAGSKNKPRPAPADYVEPADKLSVSEDIPDKYRDGEPEAEAEVELESEAEVEVEVEVRDSVPVNPTNLNGLLWQTRQFGEFDGAYDHGSTLAFPDPDIVRGEAAVLESHQAIVEHRE